MGAGKTPEQWEALKDKWQAKFGNNGHGNSLSIEVQLLPTPIAGDGTKASSNPETNQRRIDKGQQPFLTDIVQTTWRVTEEGNEPHLLPTPRAMTGGPDNTAGKDRPSGHKGTTNLHGLVQDETTVWGKYASAIERWQNATGQAPPSPTVDGKLSPAFVEWMMGYPEGWIANLPRTAALKALGNAIVPLQAATAWRHLLER
jgi:DNA (cytosine-5)-methyltransferase 1